MRETRFKIQWPNPDTLFLYYHLHIRKREAAFFLNYVEKSIAYGFGNLFKNLFKWRNTTNVLVTGQTRTQSPFIYKRKGKWKGKLMRAKALGRDGEKGSFSSFLPLLHHELTKSFPFITA